MCYKKPGPRCASYARLKIDEILKRPDPKNEEERTKNHTDYFEAFMDYVSSPSVMKAIENSRELGEETIFFGLSRGNKLYNRDFVENYVNVRELEVQAAAYRAKRLEEYHRVHGDTPEGTHELEWHIPSTDFIPDGERRNGVDGEENQSDYLKEASSFLSKMTPDEVKSMFWITSDGSDVLNRHLIGKAEGIKREKRYEGRHDAARLLESEYTSDAMLDEHVERLQNLGKRLRRDEPIMVYRGLKRNQIDSSTLITDKNNRSYDVDEAFELSQQSFKVGETVELAGMNSTSVSKGVASKFALGKAVFEIKTKTGIPLGGVSAWGATEQEILIPAGVRYKVVGVTKQEYSRKVSQNSSRAHEIPGFRTFAVIQLEEIDEPEPNEL